MLSDCRPLRLGGSRVVLNRVQRRLGHQHPAAAVSTVKAFKSLTGDTETSGNVPGALVDVRDRCSAVATSVLVAVQAQAPSGSPAISLRRRCVKGQLVDHHHLLVVNLRSDRHPRGRLERPSWASDTSSRAA